MKQDQCKKCGKCCRSFDMKDGKYMIDDVIIEIKNKTCQFLTKDNLCSIHKNKPKFCKEWFCK